jgi:outer membrane protein TolC
MSLSDLFLRGAGTFVCLATLLAAPGSAQEVLTLDRCITLARESNPRPRLAQNAVQTAELSLSELGKSALPQISGIGTAAYAPMPPTWGYDPAVTDGGQLSGQIVLHQSIYDAGIRSLKSDQLRLDVEKAVREKDLSEIDLTFAVKQAYSDALQAREEIVVRYESLGELQAYGQLVRRLHSGGTANYEDVLKAEMQTSMASLALAQARESSAAAGLSLSELIGVPVDTTVELSDTPADASGLPPELHDPEQNLEMSVARLGLERSLLDIEVVNHEHLPVVSLVADAGYLSSGVNLRLPSAVRLNTWGYSIGLGLEIPILNWGATGLRAQQRELAADDFRLQMELLQRSLSTEFRKTLLQLMQARARRATLEGTISKARENFLLTKSKYAGGGALALEVFAGQRLMTESRIEEVRSRADIRSLSARLERLSVRDSRPTRQ